MPSARLVALLALLAPASAAALGPESVFLSAEAAMTGGAALAADDVGGCGWYNPASLGAVRRSSVQLGASAYSVRAYRLQDALVTELPWGRSRSTARDTGFDSVPAALAYALDVGEGLGLAFGLWTPSSASQAMSLGGASSGPYPDPAFPDLQVAYEQRYGLSLHGRDTWLVAAAGWQARPSLRVGGGLQVAYSTSSSVADLQTSLRTSSVDPLEQGAHLNVSIRSDEAMVAARGLLGLQWDVAPSLRLAAALRSPAVRVVAWGETSRLLSASALLPGFAPQVGQVVRETSPEGGLSIVDTGRLSGGLAWGRGAWSLRVDGDWSPPLSRRAGGAKASWDLRAGALHRWSEDLTLGAGAFREGARRVASQGHLSLDVYGASFGLSYRPAKVVRALGGGKDWDLVSGLAGRVAYGTGRGPGMTVVPFDLASSELPIAFGDPDRGYLEVPASAVDAALHVFTTLSF